MPRSDRVGRPPPNAGNIASDVVAEIASRGAGVRTLDLPAPLPFGEYEGAEADPGIRPATAATRCATGAIAALRAGRFIMLEATPIKGG